MPEFIIISRRPLPDGPYEYHLRYATTGRGGFIAEHPKKLQVGCVICLVNPARPGQCPWDVFGFTLVRKASYNSLVTLFDKTQSVRDAEQASRADKQLESRRIFSGGYLKISNSNKLIRLQPAEGICDPMLVDLNHPDKELTKLIDELTQVRDACQEKGWLA